MKKVLTYLIPAIGIAVGVAMYLFFKQPPDVRSLEPDFRLTADELVDRYSDEEAGNAAFVGKIISVTGKVSSIGQAGDNWTVYLETGDPLAGVTCSFYPDEAASVQNIRPGDEVTIKGSCTGKILDVVLNHCSITE